MHAIVDPLNHQEGLEINMNRSKNRCMTRRRVVAGAGVVAASQIFTPSLLRAQLTTRSHTLRLLRWKNFVPAYETWFNDVFIRNWGEANDTDVIVTNVGMGDIGNRAAAEIAAGEGHDLVLFLSPKPSLEDHTIDHRDLHEECERRFGKAHAFVGKSNVNPRTGRHHGFIEGYIPTLLVYRKDVWDAVGTQPATWDDVLSGGRAARLLHNAPVGISFAPEHNAEHSLRALMAAFGAAIQNEGRNPALASKRTLDALNFGKALFEETMPKEVLNWTPPSNNLAVLSGEIGLTIDTMSIIRAAEANAVPVEPQLALAELPEGPVGRGGPTYGTNTFVIWKFARNIEGAKKFLLDYMGALGEGLVHNGFQIMPSYPGAVPDIADIIRSSDNRPGRYDLLLQLPETLTNLGHPGHSNAATDEVLNKRIISQMFAKVVAGQAEPQEAMDMAQAQIAPIFEMWREAGKI